jgi:hypothetical protein
MFNGNNIQFLVASQKAFRDFVPERDFELDCGVQTCAV